MALTLLLATVCLEAALAICRMRFQTMRLLLREYGRFALLLLLAAAVAAQWIHWGIRWYLAGGLLLAWAAIGGVRLIRAAQQSRRGVAEAVPRYTPGRAIRRAAGAVLLMAIALTPAFLFPERPPLESTGPHAVATETRTFTDRSRADPYSKSGEPRRLTVQFWYPAQAPGRSCPLVVFSHGSFGVRTSNVSLFQELASHGYVVASIDHTHQCLYTTDEEGRTIWMDPGYVQEVQREDAHTDRQQSFAYYQKWMSIRTADLNFVIDTVRSEAENQKDGPCGLTDASKIAVMGHSLGGSAALGVGRQRGDVDAVIVLEAPFLCDITGVAEGGFVYVDEPYPVPVLNVYSDSAWGHLDEWTQYARNQDLRDNPGGTAETLHLPGAWHLDLTDLSRTSPFFTRMLNGGQAAQDPDGTLRALNRACLDFLNLALRR